MDVQAVLEDIFFVILYGGVTMLEVVAALYLLLRRGNAIAPDVTSPVRLRRWAAAFLTASASSHLLWLLYVDYPTPSCYLAAASLDTVLLLPTMAGMLLSMLQDRHRPVWPILAALAPVAVVSLVSILRGDETLVMPMRIYILVLEVLFALYMVFAVRRYGHWLRDNYADLEHKEIWESLVILAVFLLFFLFYGIADDGEVYRYLVQVDGIVVVALILWRVETLKQLSEHQLATESEEDLQKASAPHAIPDNIGPLLKKHCEEAKLFLQHDLNLTHLSHAIGTNHYYLSQHFARQGLTYNTYINGLRIRHFIRMYHEAVSDQRVFTAQQLAFESGFHSYSTFSAAFKQSTGTTVKDWMSAAAE